MIRTEQKPQGYEYGVSTFSAYYDPERKVMVIQHNDTYQEWDIQALDRQFRKRLRSNSLKGQK